MMMTTTMGGLEFLSMHSTALRVLVLEKHCGLLLAVSAIALQKNETRVQ